MATTELEVVDAHAGGDVVRVIVGGAPALRGDSVLERMRDLRDHHDAIRRLLMREPRGARHMCPLLLVPPARRRRTPG